MRAVIEHRKTTAAEGRSVLFHVAYTLAGFGIFQWFMPFPDLFFVIFCMVVGGIALIAIDYAVANLRSNSTFVCRIDDQQFTCTCPVPLCGESFSIPITAIAKIEKSDRGDSEYDWYIWNKDGQRFHLTSNYDNPVDTFIDAIREQCPDVIEIRS